MSEAPTESQDWLGLVDGPLPIHEASDWVVLPSCGAVAMFSGTARDHSEGRSGVTMLAYEAYEEPAQRALSEICADMRIRFPTLGRIAMLHRLGVVPLGESAVVVAVSAPHRPEAFEAARYGIDTIKETVPIWKKETWSEGEDWGADTKEIRRVGSTTDEGKNLRPSE